MSDQVLSRDLSGALLGDLPRTADDEETDRLLDVAMEEVTRYGITRTSLTDVARRAGVSRPTAYRRLGNKDALLRRLMLRVTEGFFEEFAAAVAGVDDAEDRAVEGFVAGLRTARAHPMVTKLLEDEPEAVLPVLTTHGPLLIAMVRDEVAGFIDPDGTLSARQADLVVEMLVRLALSFLVTKSDAIDLDDGHVVRTIARGSFGGAIAAGREPGRSR